MSARLSPLPDDFRATVAALHRVAEDVVAAERMPENEIALEATPGGFGTPEFEWEGSTHQIRVEGAELVREVDGRQQRESLEVDAHAAEALAAWYAFGAAVLERLAATAGPDDAASPPILWPEHFDIAIELGSEADGHRATYGLSPGDEQHPEPYAYVGPWVAQAPGELWNARGFAGAELAYADLLAAEDQAAAALEFFTACRDALAKIQTERGDEVTELTPMQAELCEKSETDYSDLKAFFINCTLKRSPEVSNTQGLMEISMEIMRRNGVAVECIRAIDHEIATGVWPDMTEHGWDADEWPAIFERVLAADILVLGMPIWLGEKSSVATRVIERLYGNSSQLNEKGQYAYYGRVGGCLVTGNEDGVKHCAMNTLYSLQHLGYTIPPQADSGWIGEAGPGPSYLDEGSGGPENDFTNRNTTFAAWNMLHLARMLKDAGGIPAHGNQRTAWDAGCRTDFLNPEHR